MRPKMGRRRRRLLLTGLNEDPVYNTGYRMLMFGKQHQHYCVGCQCLKSWIVTITRNQDNFKFGLSVQ